MNQYQAADDAWNESLDGNPAADASSGSMKYLLLRAFRGADRSTITQTWFEVDAAGFIHRNFQLDVHGLCYPNPRFSPEEIFNITKLPLEKVQRAPNINFIDEADFEKYWDVFKGARSFLTRVPNLNRICFGQCQGIDVCWSPDGQEPGGFGEESGEWIRVPGFERLLVAENEEDESAEKVYRLIFLGRPIVWWNIDGEYIGES